VNVLRLALVLTLLGGPQALHMGPQDPNFTENLVDGNWFSIARASNEPNLLRTDSDTMFFIHKIHVTFKTTQFHVHRRVKGRCTPIVLTASKTRRKFQYVLKYAGHNTIFTEKAGPHRSVVFCIHNRRHRKKTVMVDLLSEWPPPRNRPPPGQGQLLPQPAGAGGWGSAAVRPRGNRTAIGC
uniref:Lipocalin/cytosolic fatty-acid binding domain-containing protein n=1 Tax=Panthera leo TaxID=9689 RepID=A0A8C9D7F8_PANLE